MTTNLSFKNTWRTVAYAAAATFAMLSLPQTAAAAPLVNQASGTCLDLPNLNATPGTAVDIWTCDNGKNQQWDATAAGELRTLDGTRCLDASGGGTTNGTKVISYTCHGGTNQKWNLLPNGLVTNQASGLCLDLFGSKSANGSEVGLWGCNGGPNQIWSRSGGNGNGNNGNGGNYTVIPGFIGIDLKNNTRGVWRDDQVFVTVIAINPANNRFSTLRPDGTIVQLNPADNDGPGHLNKGGVNYANYSFTLAQAKLLKLPKMYSGRIFISTGAPMHIKTLIDGAGNVGFAGPNPQNPSDPNNDIYFDWYEFTYNDLGLWINTTQVDQFGIPLLLDVWGDRKNFHKQVGITDTRDGIYQKYSSQVPGEFRSAASKFRIMAPAKAGLGEGQANRNYFDGYVNQVWDHYRNNTLTIDMWGNSRRFDGRVQGDRFVFTEVNKGNGAFVGGSYSIARKPNTQEILEGRGVLAQGNPTELAIEAQICAAFNRHIMLEGGGQFQNPGSWYRNGPANYYAKFWHDNSVGALAYGFAYDDVSEQSSTVHTTAPEHMVFTVGW